MSHSDTFIISITKFCQTLNLAIPSVISQCSDIKDNEHYESIYIDLVLCLHLPRRHITCDLLIIESDDDYRIVSLLLRGVSKNILCVQDHRYVSGKTLVGYLIIKKDDNDIFLNKMGFLEYPQDKIKIPPKLFNSFYQDVKTRDRYKFNSIILHQVIDRNIFFNQEECDTLLLTTDGIHTLIIRYSDHDFSLHAILMKITKIRWIDNKRMPSPQPHRKTPISEIYPNVKDIQLKKRDDLDIFNNDCAWLREVFPNASIKLI